MEIPMLNKSKVIPRFRLWLLRRLIRKTIHENNVFPAWQIALVDIETIILEEMRKEFREDVSPTIIYEVTNACAIARRRYVDFSDSEGMRPHYEVCKELVEIPDYIPLTA